MANGNKKTTTEIVTSAFNYMKEVMGSQASKINDVRIEELEPTEDGKFWNVVLSYELSGDFAFERTKEYKQFKVDAKTGEVISMKIKKV